MKKSIRRIVWLAAIVLVGMVPVIVPVSQVRADTSPPLMTLDSSSLPVTLVSQSVISGQDVVTNWADTSGDTFTLAGPASSVLYLGTDPDGWPYVKVSPPLISTSAITGDQAIAQYAASGLSLSQDAVAVGFSSTEAQQLVDAANDGKIISHVCIKTHWSGAETHECDTQHLLQSNGSRDWYIGNSTIASAQRAGHGALYWFRTYVTYNTHDAIDWSPASSMPEGNCTSVTLTAGLGKGNGSGSVSATQTVCPDSLDPFFPPIDGFGALWSKSILNANCSTAVEGDPSVSTEYDAGGASTDNYSLWVKAKWLDYCVFTP